MRRISLFGALILLALASPLTVTAESEAKTQTAVVATLIKQEGRVQLLREGEIRKRNATAGTALAAGDMLITLADSHAELKMSDGSTLVLTSDSRLTLMNSDRIRQGKGTIYYEIRPRLVDHRLSVETDFVVIGVKGTTFLVASDENDRRLSMKEGRVDVASLAEGFELYREKNLDEYQRYLQERQQEFEAYQSQQQAEFVAFVKEFEVVASRTVSFDSGRAFEQANSAAIEAEFASIEAFLSEPSE